MIVSGCTGSFVAPGSSGSEGTESPKSGLHLEFGDNSSVVVPLVFECFGAFLYIFLQMRQLGPHPYHSAFGGAAALGWLLLCLRLNLYGWFRVGRSNSIVSRRDWPNFS